MKTKTKRIVVIIDAVDEYCSIVDVDYSLCVL